MSGAARIASVDAVTRPHPIVWLRANPRSADMILAACITAAAVTVHLLELDQTEDFREPSWWTVPLHRCVGLSHRVAPIIPHPFGTLRCRGPDHHRTPRHRRHRFRWRSDCGLFPRRTQFGSPPDQRGVGHRRRDPVAVHRGTLGGRGVHRRLHQQHRHARDLPTSSATTCGAGATRPKVWPSELSGPSASRRSSHSSRSTPNELASHESCMMWLLTRSA